MRDCNKCKHMLLTEREQNELYKLTGNKYTSIHVCAKHGAEIHHFDFHPHLVPCTECDGRDYERRDDR
jgi:hypothetical protein